MNRAAVLLAVTLRAQLSSCVNGPVGSVAAGLLGPCERSVDCAQGLSCSSGACTVIDAGMSADDGAPGAMADGSLD